MVQCQVYAQDCKEDLVFSVGQVAVHLVHFSETEWQWKTENISMHNMLLKTNAMQSYYTCPFKKNLKLYYKNVED